MDCWHRELDRATSEDEVALRANDYLSLWAPRELEALTLGWRELRIESAADIETMKRRLLEAAGGATNGLAELAGYFWHAATRIGQINRSCAAPRPAR